EPPALRRGGSPGYRRPRRKAFVTLDRNHILDRNTLALPEAGSGVGVGGGTPTEITLAAVLFAVDSSVAVVLAWALVVYVPAAVARNVSRIVFVAPAARFPTAHVFVVALNSAGVE